jgi:hypothetical protein
MRSKVRTVFARSDTGIVGSNSTQRMDVCVCVYSVSVVVALRRADHSSKESYSLCEKDYETEEEFRAQQRAVELLMNEMKENLQFNSVLCLFTSWPNSRKAKA